MKLSGINKRRGIDAATVVDDERRMRPEVPGLDPLVIDRVKEALREVRGYHVRELYKRTLLRLAIIDLTLRGFSRMHIRQTLRCGNVTITKWRRRFAMAGVSSIVDRLQETPGPKS